MLLTFYTFLKTFSIVIKKTQSVITFSHIPKGTKHQPFLISQRELLFSCSSHSSTFNLPWFSKTSSYRNQLEKGNLRKKNGTGIYRHFKNADFKKSVPVALISAVTQGLRTNFRQLPFSLMSFSFYDPNQVQKPAIKII